MTTKPRAKKFRIRRPGEAASSGGIPTSAGPPTGTSASAGQTAATAPSLQPGPRTDDGFGSAPFPTAAAAAKPAQSQPQPSSAAAGKQPVSSSINITMGSARTSPPAGVEKGEEFTSRQLRMARRLAHRHGLEPRDDADAVRMLRQRGIDPFERSNLLELVVPEGDAKKAEATPNLPKTVPDQPPPPAFIPADTPATERAREILEIQRDIARRRRRRMSMLVARLTAFVILPTILVGYYFYRVATPMYATKSEFVIQQAEQPAASGLGGLLSGTGFATSQDSIAVQSYLQSRESMLRLEDDIGFRAHFEQPWIDALQRLDTDATNEAAYKHYTRHVQIGYDPTEGIIKMEVIAADPDVSAAFSRALITYAEEQVDAMSLRLREDQMRGAMESYREAEMKMEQAQERVLELQERLGVLDPASESASVMSQVSSFETQLAEKRLALHQLLDNPSPNQARVSGVEGDIERLQQLIADLRSQLTNTGAATESLARVSAQLQMAQVDLETRTMMMQESLGQLEAARIEANRQVRYLSSGVNPIPPDEATYPRAFENTLLAFGVFAGIYLMLSLTVSILREQVSA